MKKGFTLVELLSVIVILAIISLIATPALVNVIESSRKSAKESSAKGYINSVNDQIVSNEFSEDTTTIKDGTYYTQALTNVYNLEVVGEKPEKDSWIIIKNGSVFDYSLKFDKYVVNLEAENAKASVGDVKEHDVCFKIRSKRKRLYTYGDEYSCYVGDGKVREFYLLEDGDAVSSTGTTPTGALSLIMDRNFGGVIKGDMINKYITNIRKSWNLVDVILPTGYQIAKATGNNSYTSGSYELNPINEKFLVSNLDCDILKCSEIVDDSYYDDMLKNDNYVDKDIKTFGYWTSTSLNETWNWAVRNTTTWENSPGLSHVRIDFIASQTQYGVRPVIVISK